MTNQNDTQRLTVAEIVQPILDEGRKLELTSRDISLLAMLQYQIDNGSDGLLTIPYSAIQVLNNRLDVFDVKDEQSSERRLTESLTRLLAADCINKADINRLKVSADTEYQITTLGEAIADWHVEQSRFSGEPLTAIFRAFINQLAKIVEEAERAETAEDWHSDVVMQMQHVLRDMLINIGRHQKELDRQHATIRAFIPNLLTKGSEVSIGQCEAQLAEVIHTIEDLQEAVLSSASTAFSLLDRISTLAQPLQIESFDTVMDDVSRRLNMISTWTTQRAVEWFDHHNVVHMFLRTVIRIDRQKRLTEALKKAISYPPDWTLEVANEPRFIRMRDDVPREHKTRQPPRLLKDEKKKERPFDQVEADELPDVLMGFLLADMEESEEARTSRLLAKAAFGTTPSLMIQYFPWLMEQMLAKGALDKDINNWEAVSDVIEVQELRVTKK